MPEAALVVRYVDRRGAQRAPRPGSRLAEILRRFRILCAQAGLRARLSAVYRFPDNAEQLLLKASEVIDQATQGRAQRAWESRWILQPQSPSAGYPVMGAQPSRYVLRPSFDQVKRWTDAITDATCDQVEFWLEAGEEHDVLGLTGSLNAGRVQVGNLPGTLGKRALRSLLRGGMYWSGAALV